MNEIEDEYGQLQCELTRIRIEKEKIDLKRGGQITENIINRTKNIITDYFVEKGYFLVDVNIIQKNDTTYQNTVILYINIDKTLKYAEEAGELATQTDFAKGKAESLRIIGIYYWIKLDYPKALEYYQKSLKISIEIGDKSTEICSYKELGSLYLKQKKTKDLKLE